MLHETRVNQGRRTGEEVGKPSFHRLMALPMPGATSLWHFDTTGLGNQYKM